MLRAFLFFIVGHMEVRCLVTPSTHPKDIQASSPSYENSAGTITASITTAGSINRFTC
jgi:hypothetical protein